MSIEVSCECAMTYRLPDRFAGKRCRCRECGDSIRVPTLDERDASDSDSGSSESEEEAAPVKKAAKRPIKARVHSLPSESLHQMAPLNLSESRCIDPPAARARIKKAKAAAATVNAKRRSVGGPASESELDTAPRKKEKVEKKAKKKGASGKKAEKKKLLGRSRSGDDDEDELPSKKKTNKKSKLGKGKARAKDDADDSESDEGEEEKPRLSPRQQQKRQQLMILGGSIGALVAVVVLFFAINAISASKREQKLQNFADAKKKIADAHDVLRSSSDIAAAEKAYAATIAFVDDKKANAFPDEDELGDFGKEYAKFKLEQSFFARIADARRKLAADPSSAFDDFNTLAGADDDAIREIGIIGLSQTTDQRAGQVLAAYLTSPNAAIKYAARRGVIQAGGKAAEPLLAAAIREEGPNGPIGKLAIEKALEGGAQANVDALIAVCEKDSDAGHQIAAINLLVRVLDPKAKPVLEKLAQSSNAEVQAAAQKALAELKGFDKG